MFIAINHYGILKISGDGALKFLQGQITCNVERLANPGFSFAAHCNPQGRMISFFYLLHANNDYYLLVPPESLAITIQALKKYAIFFKLQISDVSNDYHIYASKNVDSNLDELTFPLDLNQETFELILSKTSLASKKFDWQAWEIQQHIPAIYPATSGKFIPQELNLEKLNAISFDKGCYTGQEIIARIHYRGRSKTSMYLTEITSSQRPSPGDDIFIQDNIKCGEVIRSIQQTPNAYQCLIVCEIRHAKSQTIYLANQTNSFFVFSHNPNTNGDI